MKKWKFRWLDPVNIFGICIVLVALVASLYAFIKYIGDKL